MKFTLYIPPEMHGELVAWADEENRSLNKQILHVLQKALADRAAPGKRPAR